MRVEVYRSVVRLLYTTMHRATTALAVAARGKV
jgi:hypothetical protein